MAEELTDEPSAATKRSRLLVIGLPVVAALFTLGAVLAMDQWVWILEDGSVQSDGVSAPALDIASGETLYRIGEGSSVSYSVDEHLAGSTSTAVGTTDLIAGDIAIDHAEPAAARIGTVVVNVEAFTSDSSLRDKRIRNDFLESSSHPFAEFTATSVDGLPGTPTDGTEAEITIEGDLTVRNIAAPATFTGTARLDGDVLRATVSTTVAMSTYDVGPISVSGLVTTSDEVELTFDLVAFETDPGDGPGAVGQLDLASGAYADDGIGSVSFAADVQPVLEQRCASCHTDRGVGQATFSLATAGEAAEVAPDLALVTTARYMPPWPASTESLDFAHDWSLDNDEIALIAAWAAEGGRLDVDADTQLTPSGTAIREIERDHVIVGQPYAGDARLLDDYRCLVYEFPEEASTTQWLKSFTIEPDQSDIVHHAVINHAAAETRESARELEAEDDKPGWSCSVGMGPTFLGNQIAAWAPGQQPVDYPEGTAIPIEPGDFFVVQVHYHYHHDLFPEDTTALVLDMASDAEVAEAGGALRPVSYSIYVAPAEIPCTPEEEGPLCDRDTVLAELVDTYGPAAALIPNALLARCGADLAEMLAVTDGTGQASCDNRVNNPGEIVGIFGHMHEFGASFRMTLNPDTPEERILLDIPSWSFNWQLDYRPVEQVVLTRDDVLRIECTWNRALSPMPVPRHITWNEGTADEMCYSAVATTPPRPGS